MALPVLAQPSARIAGGRGAAGGCRGAVEERVGGRGGAAAPGAGAREGRRRSRGAVAGRGARRSGRRRSGRRASPRWTSSRKSGNDGFLSELQRLTAKDADGTPAEPDTRVVAAAQRAMESVQEPPAPGRASAAACCTACRSRACCCSRRWGWRSRSGLLGRHQHGARRDADAGRVRDVHACRR